MTELSRNAAARGTLYVVATPIGNLSDISARAIAVLGQVDRVVAEDTRHSRKLMQHYAIATPLSALHEHNERELAPQLVAQLAEGRSLAIISDAGTPLISDPGFNLVRLAREAGINVVPVPGPSALICALSVSGLPTDRFAFEGFLPAKSTARRTRIDRLRSEPRTLIFYESSHRIVDSLNDMAAGFGATRQAVLARELTKQFETVHGDALGPLVDWVRNDPNQQKGEMVVLVAGAEQPEDGAVTDEAEQMLVVLLEELPIKQAAKLTARMTGINKRALYDRALQLKQ
ncbi:MAG: 16S rRNA (cytidine(1402)-2'-O)-methyltransferase [Thiogranum sp.]|nr:16S rRNA (cytidine(1402)-2'-O)-methyltransferase [Thiogranum sp.]